MIISNKVRMVVWIVMLFGGLSASLIVDEVLKLHLYSTVAIPIGISMLGITIYVAGVTGKWLSTYGKSNQSKPFGDIDRLVTVGPYSCMRHPMHLFLSLMPVEIGLIFDSFIMTLVVGPLEALAILIMALKLDERESIERFGEEYLRYRERVPAFNLRPSCISKCFIKPIKD